MAHPHLTDSPSTDDDALATLAWLAVVQAYNECAATLSQHLAPLGLSVLEHEVLVNLLRSDGLTQRELAHRCFSAKSGISMLVTRFQADGLIERRRSQEDKRAWNLSLTSKGQALAEKSLRIQTMIIRTMAWSFDKPELERLKSQMETVANSLKDLRNGA